METSAPIKLKSILLNNIRRFGTDVQIKFGKGATILVAPNGSGKTAVLEAIELALTSGVKRVAGRWAPLIREGGEHASVRVSFDDWEREVAVTKESVNVVKEGKLQTLFNDTDPDEVPFLLRLTHLLDQRDSDWFCQQSSEDAGGQLAMLPLGRQASQVSSTVAKLRPAVARKITELNGVIESRQKELDAWNALVRVRDSAQTDLSKPLTPLHVLAEDLAKIANTPVPQGLNNVAALREQWAIANTTNNQHLISVEATLNNLAQVVLVPSTYADIFDSMERLAQDLQAAKATEASYHATARSLDERITSAEFSLRELNISLVDTKLQLQRKQSYEKTAALLVSREGQRLAQYRLYEKRKAAFDAVQDTYKAALASNEVNAVLEDLARTIALQRDALAVARQSHAKWCDAVLRKEAEELRRRDSEARIDALANQLNFATTEAEKNESEYKSAKATVSAYQDAAGAIRAAISTIAEKLPDGTQTCPVCMENHGEKELRDRISEALNTIDPRLSAAMLELRAAAEKLTTSQKVRDDKSAELNMEQANRTRLNAEISKIEVEIQEAMSNNFFAGLELKDVPARLDGLQKANDDDSAELDARRAAQEAPVEVNVMTELATGFASAKGDLEECEEGIARLDEMLAETKTALVELDLVVNKEISVEQLELTLTNLEEKVRLSAAAIEESSESKSGISRTLLDLDANISRITNQLELDRGRLQTQIVHWTSAGLLAPPSNEQLESVKINLLQDKESTEGIKEKLDEIEAELARIAEAHTLSAAQQEVDKARGNHLESEHAAELAKNLKTAKDEHTQSVERKNALDEFHSQLTTRIEKIRDKVEDVVPQWQAILRRVVQEPRFSSTNLNYYRKSTKDHASIQVGLGDGNVGVADVASQAQMTDLQLSFMLSMATVHQWSSWKALLLDDPTQHHDLVHASSVFDVLRDFIVEHGFQVILTTHDAQQARFLMRKLNNDGIDAKLWTLFPSHDGMIAKQIGGPDGAETEDDDKRITRIDR